MEEQYECQLICEFCGNAKFEIPNDNYQPKDGDSLKCCQCGKMNDYVKMKNLIANAKAKEIGDKLANDLQNKIAKTFKVR